MTSGNFRKEVKMPNSYKHRSGDRKEGRLLRSLPASSKFVPYSLPDRDGASFFLDEDLDVTDAEKCLKVEQDGGYSFFFQTSMKWADHPQKKALPVAYTVQNTEKSLRDYWVFGVFLHFDSMIINLRI